MEGFFKKFDKPKATAAAAITAAAALGAAAEASAAEKAPLLDASPDAAVQVQPGATMGKSTDAPPPITIAGPKEAYPLHAQITEEMKGNIEAMRREARERNHGFEYSVNHDYKEIASGNSSYADALVQAVDGRIFSVMPSPRGPEFLDGAGEPVVLRPNAMLRVIVRDRDADYFDMLATYSANERSSH